jgi:hypothetical protein
LDPVDLRGRDVAFLKQAEHASTKGKSAQISGRQRGTYFESAAPIAAPANNSDRKLGEVSFIWRWAILVLCVEVHTHINWLIHVEKSEAVVAVVTAILPLSTKLTVHACFDLLRSDPEGIV